MDPDRPVEARVQDLVGRLTLAEKASLLIDKAAAVGRLGIPKYDAWNEALHGVVGREGVTVFPQAIALASTWDPDLVHAVATAISTEARALCIVVRKSACRTEPVSSVALSPRAAPGASCRLGRQAVWSRFEQDRLSRSAATARGCRKVAEILRYWGSYEPSGHRRHHNPK